MSTKVIDLSSIEISDLMTWDYPDFVDAFISYAEYKDGSELSDVELDELNDDRDFVYSIVWERLW